MRKQAFDAAPQLEKGQEVMIVCSVRGQNLFVLRSASSEEAVYELPKRLRNVVLIKTGTYVYARADTSRRTGAVRGDIEAIVLHHHLAELRHAEFWPSQFSETDDESPSKDVDDGNENKDVKANASANAVAATGTTPYAANCADSLSQTEQPEDWIAQGNPNRASWAQFEMSSSESENE